MHTHALHVASLDELPFEDREDFEDARRGLIESTPSLVLRDARGRAVWDMDSYAFVDQSDDPPDTVHPSLWRMARLNGIHGLFEVVPGIYQVRGYDISNMTLVEGHTGVIVIDPLISTECAAAALALYRAASRRARGQRGHLHAQPRRPLRRRQGRRQRRGRCRRARCRSGRRRASSSTPSRRTCSPAGRWPGAPPTCSRRAWSEGPRGQVDAGIGKTTSTGSITLIPPTHEVTHTGEEREIDGVPIVFQLVPDSEAPAEMNFFFPDLGVLCIAENAVHCMHNVLTPRGALVRDALGWSKYLGEAIELFGARSDVMFAQHHWPRWGKADRRASGAPSRHVPLPARPNAAPGQHGPHADRDRGARCACRRALSALVMPRLLRHRQPQRAGRLPALSGFLRRQPGPPGPVPAGRGGPTLCAARRRHGAAAGQARAAFEEGDYRWVAELCSHAVFADPENARGRARAAGVRAGAARLPVRERRMAQPVSRRRARAARGAAARAAGTACGKRRRGKALSLEQLWDAMGARLDGPRAWDTTIKLAWDFTDVRERWSVTVENGALSAVRDRLAQDAMQR